MIVHTHGAEFTQEEIQAYVKHLNEEYPNCEVVELSLQVDENDPTFVNMSYELKNKPTTNVGFDRIRRITGYLVGTLNRWNDAKIAEEQDRVKHNIVTNDGGE